MEVAHNARRQRDQAFDWNIFSRLVDGQVMRGVVLALSSHEKTQRMLSAETRTNRSSVQKSLTRLQEYGLVRCKSPDTRRSKIYALTETGVKHASKLTEWREEEQRWLARLHDETKRGSAGQCGGPLRA